MTLTSAEVAKLQKHNADLVRENETLTRDNAELRGQIEAIKQAAISADEMWLAICAICKNLGDVVNGKCKDCDECYTACNWQPPEPPDA